MKKSPSLQIGKSKTQGKGVFSNEFIKKGAAAFIFSNKIIKIKHKLGCIVTDLNN